MNIYMSVSKIQIKVGHVEFSGEGEQDWLSQELDKMLEKVPELLKIEPVIPASEVPADKPKIKQSLGSLVTWLKEKNVGSNQVKKFLATASFLQINGKDRMTTADVSSALSKSNQGKLNNPSDKLLQNIGKGYCIREGNLFYVTPEGLNELSIIVG
jgi:hypothetical protein